MNALVGAIRSQQVASVSWISVAQSVLLQESGVYLRSVAQSIVIGSELLDAHPGEPGIIRRLTGTGEAAVIDSEFLAHPDDANS